MANWRRMSRAQNFVLAGMIAGMLCSLLVTKETRLVMFVIAGAGAIAGGVVEVTTRKRFASIPWSHEEGWKAVRAGGYA